MPITVAATLVLVFAMFPGFVGNRVYESFVGLDWREREWRTVMRLVGLNRPLPTYAPPEKRPAPTLVLGETHFETADGRAPSPAWLTIPRRGLYTGVMVVGAVGTGKTSACMYR